MCFVPGDDRHVKINGGTPGGRQAALGRQATAGATTVLIFSSHFTKQCQQNVMLKVGGHLQYRIAKCHQRLASSHKKGQSCKRNKKVVCHALKLCRNHFSYKPRTSLHKNVRQSDSANGNSDLLLIFQPKSYVLGLLRKINRRSEILKELQVRNIWVFSPLVPSKRVKNILVLHF